MNEYLVSVAASGRPFAGPQRTIAKSIRVTATSPVEAGELVLDRLVKGTAWMFTSARASVTSADSHDVEATIVVRTPKAFGLPRQPTRNQWVASVDRRHASTSEPAQSTPSNTAG